MNPNIGNDNCPTCCANRREDLRIVDEGDNGDTYCDDPWHTPLPAAPADAKCNAPGCSVCAAGLPHTTHSYPMTAPAPADDAVEEAAKRVTTAYKDLRELMERRRGGGFAVSVNLGPLYEACDALDAALRGTNGGV